MSENSHQQGKNTEDQRVGPSAESRRRRQRLLKVAAIVFIIGAIAGGLYFWYSSYYESTDDAFIDGHPVTIGPRVSGQVFYVQVTDNQPVEEGDLLVEIDPCDFVIQVKQARAALEAALARQKAAQLELKLTCVTSKSGLDQAHAALDAAQANLEMAHANKAAAENRIVQAVSLVKVAQANADQARAQVTAAAAKVKRVQDDLHRYQALFEGEATTLQQLEYAQAAAREEESLLEASEKKVTAIEAQIVEAQAQLKVSQDVARQAAAQIMEAQARLVQAQHYVDQVNVVPERIALSERQFEIASAEFRRLRALIEQAELALFHTKVYAPQTGWVTKLNVVKGNYVQVGQPLMLLVPKKVWVTANFKETQLTRMRPGQPVEIKIDSYPGKSFRGHVDSIQAGTGARFSLLPPENATGNYVKVVQRVPVKIVFDEPPDSEYFLSLGMSVVPKVKVE